MVLSMHTSDRDDLQVRTSLWRVCPLCTRSRLAGNLRSLCLKVKCGDAASDVGHADSSVALASLDTVQQIPQFVVMDGQRHVWRSHLALLHTSDSDQHG